MPGPVPVGEVAPNFDLSSTEDAVLMLKDEATRTALAIYFFVDPLSERALRDLDALDQRVGRLHDLQARALAVSPAALGELKTVQARLKLRFPLLHDDRNFSALYGGFPTLAVVDRRQVVRWLASPVAAVEEVMPQVEKLLDNLPSPTKAYPKSVINRLVDFWVNR